MIGQIIKIHSDFYYVDCELGIIEAKLRDTLKKSKALVFVGDYVKLSGINESSLQAFISEIIKRKNFISRPKVANITQAIIVSALKNPKLEFEQLDRFISLCEYHNIKPILCFNKDDLDNFSDEKEIIRNIYGKLGYTILFTSALEKTGLDDLFPILSNNTTLLCGASGVGKSSLLNSLFKDLSLKTKPVSEKTQKGTHTTRHCELIKVQENSFVVDTPGFSNITFDFLLPVEVQKLFTEFQNSQLTCKFKNCLHINENECGFKKIIENFSQSRFLSYKKFVDEAKNFKEKVLNSKTREEEKVKFNFNKTLAKISLRKRTKSRKYDKQNLKYEISDEE